MRYFVRNDGRIYTVFPPSQDLLGDWVLVTVRGSTRNRRGRLKSYPIHDADSARKLEAELVGRRIRHGYLEEKGVVPSEGGSQSDSVRGQGID